jgi:hypothetical protein
MFVIQAPATGGSGSGHGYAVAAARSAGAVRPDRLILPAPDKSPGNRAATDA